MLRTVSGQSRCSKRIYWMNESILPFQQLRFYSFSNQCSNFVSGCWGGIENQKIWHNSSGGFEILKKNFFLNWSMVDLQYCVNFLCTEKWLSCTYMYILFHILYQYGLSYYIKYISQHCIIWLCIFILYVNV